MVIFTKITFSYVYYFHLKFLGSASIELIVFNWGSENLFGKGQILNILGFAGKRISVTF